MPTFLQRDEIVKLTLVCLYPKLSEKWRIIDENKSLVHTTEINYFAKNTINNVLYNCYLSSEIPVNR